MMLGGHEARLDAMEGQVKEIREDVAKILGYMERTKGSWKTLVAMGGLIAGLVEVLHWIFEATGGKHG